MPFPLKKTWPRTPGEAVLLVRVLWMLTRARAQLRRQELPEVLALYSPAHSAPSRNDHALERVRGFVDGLCARIPAFQDKRCLPRSVVLYHFATKHGFPVILHCGVQKTAEDRLDGHAWLSLDGHPFLEADGRVDAFVVTYSYPES